MHGLHFISNRLNLGFRLFLVDFLIIFFFFFFFLFKCQINREWETLRSEGAFKKYNTDEGACHVSNPVLTSELNWNIYYYLFFIFSDALSTLLSMVISVSDTWSRGRSPVGHPQGSLWLCGLPAGRSGVWTALRAYSAPGAILWTFWIGMLIVWQDIKGYIYKKVRIFKSQQWPEGIN